MSEKEYKKQVRRHYILTGIIIVVCLAILIGTLIYIKKNFIIDDLNLVEDSFMIAKIPITMPRILL